MLVSSNRLGSIGGSNDIWVSTRATTSGAWSTPVNLGPPINSEFDDGGRAIRRVGWELLFSSNRLGWIGGSKDFGFSKGARISGAWSTPVNLGPPINSEFDDGGSALSADGTTLYFYSTRPGGFGGRDLFVATRHRIEGEDREDDRRDDRGHRRGGS